MTVRFGQLAQPACQPAHDRQRDRGLLPHDGLEVPARECQADGRLVGDDLGDTRATVEDGQLPEEVAGADVRDRPAIADDPDTTARHEEEARPDLTLPGDDVVLGELDLDDALRDHRDAVRVDAGEQRGARQQLCAVIVGEGRAGLHPGCADAALRDSGASRSRSVTAGHVGRSVRPIRLSWQTSAWHDAPMIDRDELLDAISGFGLFSDLSSPQLEAVIHIFDERMFAEGETVVHQGLSGSGFFVIVDGEALVRADGRELARLGRGDFFGEVAILLGVPAIADVVATRQMRCLVLPGPQVEPFLISHPKVMYRMLQAQARRLRAANRSGT